MKSMRHALLLLASLAFLFSFADSDSKKVKVACVGNSITYGIGVENRDTDSYPSVLSRLLGDQYEVAAFGKPGATLLRHGHRPFFDQTEFGDAMAYGADIAIVHLGVNDTDPRNWPVYAEEFIPDYLALIDSLRSSNPQMRIIIARLTPLSASHWRFKSGTRDWRIEIQKTIDQISIAAGVEVVDFDKVLMDYPNLFPDAVHPNEEGARKMAEEAYKVVTGNYDFTYPAPLQDGMVLQRYKTLVFNGTAAPGDQVTLTIGDKSESAVADKYGNWQILFPPLAEADNVAVSLSHIPAHSSQKRTINFSDVAIGEVWLASGQSNMAFTLQEAIGADEAMAQSADSLLRFYNMKPRALTQRGKWSDEDIAETNRLNYFLPTQWQKSSPESSPEMSAVAYFFGKQLRDSLNVPIGIINNAIGGATTESWIDIETLQMGMPEALVNWTSNDYVMPWAQGRAMDNMGNNKANRHPYEPSYLFASGMRPLAGYPIAGVIWYQGESNAHNIELHERLFPMLVESFRKEWSSPELPFYFVQLSSINRPSWPRFRDSQRRLMSAIPNTGMAVCSDIGDSLDVHPRDKRPVGERLAAWALNKTYSVGSAVPSGPLPVSAVVSPDGDIEITMDYAEGMAASDGQPLRTFEYAGADGIYRHAAEAIINGNKIILKIQENIQPVAVRYAWQPFTHANLVNAAGLPASTFMINIDQAPEKESGWANGISGAFSGCLDSRIVVAGGCNFPVNPMAPDSKKKFYEGIYATNGDDGAWQRIGNLPMPLAYGCSAATDQGIVIAGGSTPDRSINSAWLLKSENGRIEIIPLPPLPCNIDNAAACAVGNVVYIVGGNANGLPSNALMCLNLDDLQSGWRVLPSFPGNPRVQPVMAAAPNAKGKMCLWIFGGFSPKYDGKDATLDTDGLCFDISKKKWEAVAAPCDKDGTPISLGGGVAATLPDGSILATGGVNKDIFLSALQNQAPDYLSHPIEWYRFNGYPLVFSPKAGTWSIGEYNPDFARAGASLVSAPNGLYLIGGELKPRIRSPRTVAVTY